MQKMELLVLMAAAALLISAPEGEAAPLISVVPDLLLAPSSLNGGDQKPPCPWTSGPAIQKITETGDLAHLLHTEPRKASDKPSKATSGPSFLVKTLAVTDSIGRKVKTAPETISSDGLERPIRVDGHPTIDPVSGKTEGFGTVEGSRLYKELKLMPVTPNANKQGKTMQPARRSRIGLATGGSVGREKIVKLLSTLEEIHRSMNSTRRSHIAMIPKGNSNSGSSGKKRKMVVTEKNLKSTTVSSVVNSSTSPKASTVDGEPRHLNGKTFKKSLPSTTKKTNKRVCFWKYCSQN